MKAQKRIAPRKLKGFRDYTPEACFAREAIVQNMRQQALHAGFQEIATPAMEYEEVLLGSSGGDTEKEVYRFVDHGDRAVALRYDLTVPFARYVAEHQGTLSLPFKKFQVGDVWRGEKPQKGRYRQFAQADVDIVGADTALADAEVIGVIAQSLTSMLPNSATTMISHRKVLSGLIQETFRNTSADHEPQILIALDKLSKIGRDKVISLLLAISGITEEQAAHFLDLVSPSHDGETDLEPVAAKLAGHEEALAGLQRLQVTKRLLTTLSLQDRLKVTIDLSIARGLGYYTGIVFETFIDTLPGFGSVASGGRYDELVSRFSSQPLAGVGGSLGVDRLLAALEELNALPAEGAPTVFVALAGDEVMEFGFGVLQRLRAAGISSDIAVKMGKLAQQFKYADRLGIPFVATIGDTEMSQNAVTLKHLRSGKQEMVPIADLAARIRTET